MALIPLNHLVFKLKKQNPISYLEIIMEIIEYSKKINKEVLVKKYIFNRYYSMRNDRKRIVLLNAPAFKVPSELAEESISTFIHPLYAIVFSFFNGKQSLGEILEKISNMFELSYLESFNVVKPFLENKKRVGIDFDGHMTEFPRMILLDNTKHNFPVNEMDANEFVLSEEFNTESLRLYEGPTSLTILFN